MAVVFDNVGPSSSGQRATSGTTLSWSHTVNTGPADIYVGTQWDGNLTPTITATAGGSSMSSLGTEATSGNASNFLQMFRITGKAAGTYTITLTSTQTLTGDWCAGSVSYTGVSTIGTVQKAQASTVNVGTTSTSNIVLQTGGAGNTITAESGTNRVLNNVTGSAGGNLGNLEISETAATGGTVTMSFTTAASANSQAIMAVELQAATAVSQAPIVVSKPRRRRGVIWYRKAPPVFTAPNQFPKVITFRRRNKGVIAVLAKPIIALTQVPIVHTFTRRNKGQHFVSYRLPQAYPQPPIILHTSTRRNKGRVVVTVSTLPPVAPPPPPQTPLIRTFTHKNKGRVLVTHQLPQAYPQPPVLVHTFTRRNKGQHIVLYTPFLLPPTPPTVKTFTRRNKGQIHLLSFPPLQTTPTQQPVIHTYIRRNKGVTHLLTFPPVFKAPTQKPQVYTFIRRNKGVIWFRATPPVSSTPPQPPAQFSGCGPYTYWKQDHLPNWQTFVELATCIALNVTLLGEGAAGWPLSILRDSTNHPVKTLSNGAIEDRGLKLLASVALRAPIV